MERDTDRDINTVKETDRDMAKDTDGEETVTGQKLELG
jgi:hypothetical protein